ncbi:hypothetical protein G3I34_10100 [Streptomyces sp. SID8014]|uniref:hypothetical protein n=1 Tax=Streptomyces sp. SID8014 TaxID=2706097 RepID=UPI0013B9F6A4|nr:hypothetical protein [Streptomyces sp. SID8014]NEC12625.1 hypothetical protein [Streptomyces sp. SID8014]
MTRTTLLERALIEEATKKSGLIWVQGGAGGPRPVWHAWLDGAAVLVGDGPGEQPLPGLADGGEASVTVRSKDKGGRLLTWRAEVAELAPGSEAWEAAAAELKGKRLNAPDSDRLTGRWAAECRVVRLAPTGDLDPLPDSSLAEPPAATPATTRDAVPAALPRLLFGPGRRKARGKG